MKQLLTALLFSYGVLLNAQSQLTEHTAQLDEGAERSSATVEDMSWLIGHWTGEGLGGKFQETWNPPMGGTMLGAFRLESEDMNFYELCTIEPDGPSVVMKVKHFNTDLSAWEEGTDYMSFPLIHLDLDEGLAFFEGLTFEFTADDMTVYLAIEMDGEMEEAVFHYYRTPLEAPSKEARTQLLLLGSYHMSNPGADQFNLEADDVLTPKRQEEIQEVVERLAEFKPTMVAVESPYNDSVTIARYQAYLAGELELRRSEEEQIGFRLAAMLGHETIYPIDYRMDMQSEGLEEVIMQDPERFGPHMAELERTGQGVIQMMGEWLSEGTISEMMYNMNRPEFVDLAYQLYFEYFMPIVAEDNYAGADLIAGWYQRNLRIMSHLHMLDCSPEDRVFIVYGQGHVPLFERIAEDSPYFELVDVRPYLR